MQGQRFRFRVNASSIRSNCVRNNLAQPIRALSVRRQHHVAACHYRSLLNGNS